MSDPYGSYGQGNPYGDPPFSGQQPPQYGRPYGQPYRAGGPGGPPPGVRDVRQRPGTVLAAALVTIILSGLTALFGVFGVIETTVNRDWITKHILEDDRYEFDRGDVDAALNVLVGMSIALVVLSLVAIVLAIFVLRRSNLARILLVVLSGVTILFSLVGIASVVSVAPLVAAIVVIVLLFTGGANEWFRRTTIVPYGQLR